MQSLVSMAIIDTSPFFHVRRFGFEGFFFVQKITKSETKIQDVKCIFPKPTWTEDDTELPRFEISSQSSYNSTPSSLKSATNASSMNHCNLIATSEHLNMSAQSKGMLILWMSLKLKSYGRAEQLALKLQDNCCIYEYTD